MLEKERILTEQETSALADTPAADVLTLERKVAPSLWEDISERGANKKVYTKNGRKKEAVYFAAPVHILGTDGSYQEIEDCVGLEEENDCYRNRNSRFQAQFRRKSDSGELFRMEKDGCSLVVSALERGHRKSSIPVPQKKSEALLYADIAEKTDYLYSTFSDRVKENIVLRGKASAYRYSFLLESNGLEMRFQEKERTLTFYSLDDGEEVFWIPAPFMTDAKGAYSKDVCYEVRAVNESQAVLTILPDRSWIDAKERVFPVTIDPQIVLTGNTAIETYRWNSGKMAKEGTAIPVGSIGSGSSCFVSRMYMKLHISDIPDTARVEKATLDLRQQNSSGSKPRLCLYQVKEEITVGTCTPAIGDTMLDYVQVTAAGPQTLSFDITAAYDSMRKGETPYANLVLMAEDESGSSLSYANIYGTSAITAYQPKVTVTYENNYAENAAASTTHDLGAYGRTSIELQTGTLMITSEDMTWQGNRMPVSIRHTFCSALAGQQYTNNSTTDLSTADFSAMHLGYGWKLNYMQSIVPKTFTHESTVRNGYVYTDESGAAVYLMESTKDYFKKEYTTEEGTTEEYYMYEDLTDSGYMYDPYKRELYYCADTYTFDTEGRLIQIADQNENTLQMIYTGDRITSIVDGAGRSFTLDWDASGKLSSITGPDGDTKVQYQYTGSNLTGVTAPDGSHTKLEYTENKLTGVSLYDSAAASAYIYRVEYAYDPLGRIRKVTEKGEGNITGQSAFYTYNVAARTTKMENTIDNGDKTETVYTVYTFDNDGTLLGSYAYVQNGDKVQFNPSGTGINPYVSGISYGSNGDNLLHNHSFQSLEGWSLVSGFCSTLTARSLASSTDALFGKTLLYMKETVSNSGDAGVYQLTNMLSEGEYTFSAYVRLLTEIVGVNGTPGVFLKVTDTSNNVIAQSERITEKSDEYIRLVVPFTLHGAQSVKVWICINGRAELHVDAAQLEKNVFAGPYNLLENGNFERDTTGWTCTDEMGVNTTDCFSGTRSLFIPGDLNSVRCAAQNVDIRSFADVRESFTLSGYAKASALPAKERNNGRNARFRLMARIVYSDGTAENHIADFSPSTQDWQYAFVHFSKSKFKSVDHLEVSCEYSYNAGIAKFDCIQLVQNNYESGLTKYSFPGEYEEGVAEETSPQKEEEASNVFEEAVDAYGNRITETIFQEGKYGTIYRSFMYNSDDKSRPGDSGGNDQIRITDERGNNTYFTVDSETSRILSIQDRNQNKTAFSYDANGRLSQMSAMGEGNTSLADISYSYDKMGHLTKMTRGDDASFTYDYNRYHRLSEIYANSTGSTTEYTYKSNNGRLKTIAMADGAVTYIYNRYGQILSETWTNDGETTHRYKYVYDSDGKVVRVIDIKNHLEYNYYYRKGSTISRITESEVVLDENEIVTSKTPICTICYRYNSSGTLTGKRIEQGDFSQEYKYELAEDGSLIVTLPDGTTSQYSTDHFGRKTSDELKFGSGFLSRKYTYLPGQITQEHRDHKKVKSEPTTRLVDTITYSTYLEGQTIRYEYDGEQRITKITDSADGTSEYTYNDLGQLTREYKNGVLKTAVTYDSYGNILTKGGKTYTYSSAYKDRLISYGGEAITYTSSSPNPRQYRGWDLTWSKGSQLASASKGDKNITFRYNLDGLRTEKTINGVKHAYILDGTRLVRDEYNDVDYLYDSERKVCGMVHEGKTYYLLKNLQGDVIALTNEAGMVIARYSYDAWGEHTIWVRGEESGSTEYTEQVRSIAEKNLFRYRSYIYDGDLGLYYLHNRYYDPQTGRFISEDPAKDGTNWYSYCNCDAVNYVDPTGLWATVGLGYQAEAGDTLWRLAVLLFGNGIYWEDLGYPYDIKKRPLQVGDIISYDGGLVTIENGVVVITASYLLYNPDGTRHIPQTMPDPPRQDPPKNPSSGAPSNPTPTKPNPDSVSSTAGPGNSGASGREHIGGSNSGKNNSSANNNFEKIVDQSDSPLKPYKGIEMGGIIYLDVTYLLSPVLAGTVLAAEIIRFWVDILPWHQRLSGEISIYKSFYNWVKSGGPWDLKLEECWESTIGAKYPGFDEKVCFNGWLMTPEELGNFTYGYIGGAFGIPLEVLYAGSWYAAGFPISGESLEGEYKDRYHIESGYMAYQAYNVRILLY